MHGPDGTDYQEWIWTEIAPPERIALLHGESRGDPERHRSVISFAPDGGKTGSRCARCSPPRSCEEAVEKYRDRGRPADHKNLAAYVTEIVRKGAEG